MTGVTDRVRFDAHHFEMTRFSRDHAFAHVCQMNEEMDVWPRYTGFKWLRSGGMDATGSSVLRPLVDWPFVRCVGKCGHEARLASSCTTSCSGEADASKL